MEIILRPLQRDSILIYLDDIVIQGSNFKEHMSRLQEVLRRISDAGLKLKLAKSELFKTEVLFLGHIVGQNGIRPNPKLIDSVRDWTEPTSVKGIQKFVSFTSPRTSTIVQFIF